MLATITCYQYIPTYKLNSSVRPWRFEARDAAVNGATSCQEREARCPLQFELLKRVDAWPLRMSSDWAAADGLCIQIDLGPSWWRPTVSLDNDLTFGSANSQIILIMVTGRIGGSRNIELR